MGMFTKHCPYVSINDDIEQKYAFTRKDMIDAFNLKIAHVHSQLYIINNNFNFVYDPDEYEESELIVRTTGKLSCFKMLDLFPIQTVTDDMYCIFHNIITILLICKYKIKNFNKKEIRRLNNAITCNWNIRYDTIVSNIIDIILLD